MRNPLKTILLRLALPAWLLIAVAGCSSMGTSRTITPAKLSITNTMELPFQVQKCLLDYNTDTYYLLEQNRPNLYFYRLGKQVNALGGLGTDQANFRKLTDIALDPDGNLLALDSFARLIRKFDTRGQWIADIDLSGFDQPTRFCSTPEGDLIIYDAADKELTKLSALDKSVLFTFGRFQVDSVSSLSVCRNLIAVINDDASRSLVFSGLGMYMKAYDSDLVVDQYDNKYIYQDRAVRLVDGVLNAPLGWPDKETRLFATPYDLLVVHGSNVTTLRPLYGE